jgi:hypothetical protein
LCLREVACQEEMYRRSSRRRLYEMTREETRACRKALDLRRYGSKYEAMAGCAVFGIGCLSAPRPDSWRICVWKARGTGENRATKMHQARLAMNVSNVMNEFSYRAFRDTQHRKKD